MSLSVGAVVCVGHHGDEATPTYNVTSSCEAGNDVSDDDKTALTAGSDCRLCRHSCTDRPALHQHLVQVASRDNYPRSLK